MVEIIGRRVRHPFNALDLLKEKVHEQLGHEGFSVNWEQSEYCDNTFILILRMRNVEIEFNVLFRPDSYSVSAGNNCSDELLHTMQEKLDACIHY
jgi:hypothetical protein